MTVRIVDKVSIVCARCATSGVSGCEDCSVTAFRGTPAGRVELDADERQAVVVLQRAGLVASMHAN